LGDLSSYGSVVDTASLDDWRLEFLRRCVGHHVTGWFETWSSYGGVLDTASLDDWSIGVLTEVCWTPRHWMIGVLEFLRRCV